LGLFAASFASHGGGVFETATTRRCAAVAARRSDSGAGAAVGVVRCCRCCRRGPLTSDLRAHGHGSVPISTGARAKSQPREVEPQNLRRRSTAPRAEATAALARSQWARLSLGRIERSLGVEANSLAIRRKRRGETLDRCSAAASDPNDLSESARTAGTPGLLYRCHCQLGGVRDRA